MSQARLQRRILEDIQRQLARRLADAQVWGRLELDQSTATLEVSGAARHVPLGDLPVIWPRLAPGERLERLESLARGLVGADLPRKSRGALGMVLSLLALGALTSGLSVAVVRGLAEKQAQAIAATKSSGPIRDVDRAERVCEAVRSRVMRGGTAGPTDYEGWAVELSFVTPEQLAQATDFEKYFAAGPEGLELVWTQAPEAVQGVEPSAVQGFEHRSNGFVEQRFVLSGGYAKSYFDEVGRLAWVRLANQAFSESRARFGALYARCEHQQSHHIGAWFAGSNASDSAAALLHFAGVFSETAVFTKPYLPAEDVGRPELGLLDAFAQRAADVDRTELAMWLSEDQGSVEGRDGERISLGFPFKDSNRASRASLRIARRFEIASTR